MSPPRSDSTQRHRMVGAFADDAAARTAVAALRAAGIDESAITVAGGAPAAHGPRPEREERFLGRLVLIVIAWSIVGTGVGAVMGVIFNALSIGPGGTGGLLLQVVSWALFAHLISGMWAGYALLTTGESREPVRHLAGGRVVVSVWCDDDDQRHRVPGILTESGATAISVFGADGRRIAT